MPLVTQAAYARRRGISREAVRQRTVTAGGPIAVHGVRKLIDVEEADALWDATMTAQGASQSPNGSNGRAAPASPEQAATLTRARAAVMVAEAQLRQLRLTERRGELLDRQATLATFFTAIRAIRDAWLTWPARIGAELAADLGVELSALMIALEPYVRRRSRPWLAPDIARRPRYGNSLRLLAQRR